MGRVRGAEFHLYNEVSRAPGVCIYHLKNLDTWKPSKYCSRDVVAVMVKNLIGHECVVLVQYTCHMMRNHHQRK